LKIIGKNLKISEKMGKFRKKSEKFGKKLENFGRNRKISEEIRHFCGKKDCWFLSSTSMSVLVSYFFYD